MDLKVRVDMRLIPAAAIAGLKVAIVLQVNHPVEIVLNHLPQIINPLTDLIVILDKTLLIIEDKKALIRPPATIHS